MKLIILNVQPCYIGAMTTVGSLMVNDSMRCAYAYN